MSQAKGVRVSKQEGTGAGTPSEDVALCSGSLSDSK